MPGRGVILENPAELVAVQDGHDAVRHDQRVLADAIWSDRMTPRDLGALSPLLTQHVNPYGRFELDLDTRLELEA